MKTKIKDFIPTDKFSLGFYGGILLAVLYPIIGYHFISNSKAYFAPILTPRVEKQIITQIEEKITEKPLYDEVYMANALKEAGLNVSEAFAVVWSESRGDENAYNINSNSTIDLGVWQINSIHIDNGSITLKCVTDLECSTEWAINKRLHDGNYSAWYGARSLGIK